MGLAWPLTVERQTHLEALSAELEGESRTSMGEIWSLCCQNEQPSHKHTH